MSGRSDDEFLRIIIRILRTKRLTRVIKTIKILYANYCENICKFFEEVIGTWQQNGFICSKKVTRQ